MINGTPVQQVTEYKYLSAMIDRKLQWGVCAGQF